MDELTDLDISIDGHCKLRPLQALSFKTRQGFGSTAMGIIKSIQPRTHHRTHPCLIRYPAKLSTGEPEAEGNGPSTNPFK